MKKQSSYILFLSILFSHIHTQNYTFATFGDSHIIFDFCPAKTKIEEIWENTTYSFRSLTHDNTLTFHLRWLGPKTLHGAAMVDFISYIKQMSSCNLDALIFSFGEIDARVHIAKQASKQNRSIESIIEELVTNFYNHLEITRRCCNITIPFIIMTPIYPLVSPAKDCDIFPFYGTAAERLEITQLLINSLHKNLHHNMYIFNPYIYYTQDDFLLPEFSDRHVHFNPLHNQKIIKVLYEFCEHNLKKEKYV